MFLFKQCYFQKKIFNLFYFAKILLKQQYFLFFIKKYGSLAAWDKAHATIMWNHLRLDPKARLLDFGGFYETGAHVVLIFVILNFLVRKSLPFFLKVQIMLDNEALLWLLIIIRQC